MDAPALALDDLAWVDAPRPGQGGDRRPAKIVAIEKKKASPGRKDARAKGPGKKGRRKGKGKGKGGRGKNGPGKDGAAGAGARKVTANG